MTSLAFGAGVIPLVFAQGAGAVSRQEIGISIFRWRDVWYCAGSVFIPVMYVLLRSLFKSKLQPKSKQF